MKDYLYNYIEETKTYIASDDKKKTDDKIAQHLIKIKFFQHERWIHLTITLFYATMFLAFLVLGRMYWLFVIPALMLFVFLLFYIVHYFRLENGVQYLYQLYDELLAKKEK